MKQLILILSLSLCTVRVIGQARLGSPASKIRSEFEENHYNLTSGYNKDNTYYIKIKTERASVIYFFNNDKICTMTVIAPDNQGALNFYVQTYNNDYVIVSQTEWKMYSENGIANIKLIYPDDGGFYFVWTSA